MFNLFINEFKKKEIYIFFIFLIFVSMILMTIWSSILGATDGMTMAYELSMLVASFSISTYYYKKYNRKDFLDTSYLSGQSKTKIKINIFLYIVFWLFVYSLTVFAMDYVLIYFNIVDVNGLPFDGNAKPFPTINQLNWYFLIYAILMYIFLMTGFSILINSFIKTTNLVYGIIIIIFVSDFRFSYTIISPLQFNTSLNSLVIDQSLYDTMSHYNSIYFFPWTMIGIRLTEIFNSSTFVHELNFYQYYNLDNAGKLKIYEWLPYLYLLVIYSIPLIHSKFKIQN